MRGQSQFPKDIEKEAVILAAKEDAKVQSFLEGKEIVKEIYVPGKLSQPRGQRLDHPLVMSRFLPDNFDASRPLALIAGQGSYPILLAERATQRQASHVCLIELGGETSPDLIVDPSPKEDQRSAVKVGQVGKLLKELKEVSMLVMRLWLVR